MALTPASINITFNANYTGCHRVCWRTPGVGAYPLYDCTTQVTCTGGGASCSAIIGIMVDNTLCVPQVFDGYVQACCEDIDSPNGKLPFSVTFTPNPNCKGYTITCIGPVTVNKVIIINPGSSYVPGATIPVSIVGGGGGGAMANAIIGNGGIGDQAGDTTIFPAGSGYVNGTYNNVPAVTLTGTGSGALFKVVVFSNVVITADVVVGSNGTGYLPGDTFTFNTANIGGVGSGVVVTVNTVNTGMVQNVVMVAPGAGYTSQATATIPPSGGIQATFGVKMGSCPLVDISTCGNPPFSLQLPLGTGFVACATTPPAVPQQYSETQDACCSTCNFVTFTKADPYGPPATAYYTNCTTKAIIATVLTGGAVLGPVCAVTGSWFVIESDPVNGSTSIVVGAFCP